LSANIEAAVALANLGFAVFPCKQDKTPMVKGWEHTAPCSPFMISAKWGATPEALPAIPVGSHGLVVIDCDCKPDAANGVQAFQALCTEHSIDLSGAFQVDTPSGGQHFYFHTDTPFTNSRGLLPEGIDVRGVGGYVIGPGAQIKNAGAYRLVSGTWDAIPQLPSALAALLKLKQVTTSPLTTESTASVSVATERDLAHGSGALENAHRIILDAPKGTRNQVCFNQAAALYEFVPNGSIQEQSLLSMLWEVMEENGYLADHSDGRSRVSKTIQSAKDRGLAKPRPLLSNSIDDSILDIVRQSVAMWIDDYKRKHNKLTPQSTGRRTITLLQCSTIQAKPITWLWEGYLPQGKLTLLAGAGGTGKSTLAFNFAGTVSNGGVWPDGSRCYAPGNTLIWSSEDDPEDTILPRLIAVGANLTRCGIISCAIDEDGLRCPFDAARDMNRLRDAVQQIGGISLLIIDPIVTAVTGDMHKANDVRRSLQTIVDFASEMNCAVLGITHFAKGTAGKNSAERVIGSQAFAAFARMVLVAAKEEDSQNRVFTRAKSNNSVDTGGFAYTIEAIMLHGGIITTRVVWGEPLEGSSRAILSEIEGDSADEGSSKLNQAKAFLLDTLKNGGAPSKELFEHAREVQGITPDTMRRAGKALSIVPRKLAMSGGWVWELPITINAR
jgi:hypothetical protein